MAFSATEVNAVLSQPFSYLDEGSRMVAYLSADGQYVLKLLKSPAGIEAQFRAWGIDLGSVPWSLKPGDPMGTAELLFNRAIENCVLAYRELPEETGLVFLHHEETTDLIPEVALAGHKMDPNGTLFVIQKKARLLKETLFGLMQRGEVETAQKQLDKLLDFIIHLWRMGITENTFNFLDNYGLAGDRLIQVDICELRKDSKRVLAEIEAKTILGRDSFRQLANRYPLLTDYLRQQVLSRFKPESVFAH
jgi:hypothetical protein